MKKNRKNQSRFAEWKEASFRDMLAFQWSKVQREPRIFVLWIVEILLAVGIAVSIAIYLDPDFNVVPAPWNYVAFALLAGGAIWIHGLTKPFRLARRVQKVRK